MSAATLQAEPRRQAITAPLVAAPKRRRYYVTGWCPLTGKRRDFLWASSTAEARAAFHQKHGLFAIETEVDE